jgi:hypothetical protein
VLLLSCDKRSFLSFTYVCPEPVLVKCSFIYIYKWLKKWRPVLSPPVCVRFDSQDVMPTLAELAGVSPPEGSEESDKLDGLSLAPLLREVRKLSFPPLFIATEK